MTEHSDDFDLPTCLRRARRWAIALVGLLAVNGSLVTLAFGGFGAAPRREQTAQSVAAQPSLPVQAPVPTQPTEPAAPPADPTVARFVDPPAAALLAGPVATDPLPSDLLPSDPLPSDPLPSDPPPTSPPATPVIDPPPADVPPDNTVLPPAANSLIVANPPDTGGAVNFTVDGVVYALAPGEFIELAGRSERVFAYHRGDDFGYSTHKLVGGAHAFELCPTGWSLQPLDAAAARKLLGACRPK